MPALSQYQAKRLVAIKHATRAGNPTSAEDTDFLLDLLQRFRHYAEFHVPTPKSPPCDQWQGCHAFPKLCLNCRYYDWDHDFLQETDED